MPSLDLGLGFARGPVSSAPPPLILDSLSAGAAYSTRRLRTAYTGAALRVRRSSDNTEQDIGFSGNALDTTALTSFVGANSGFVVTWYDQSGNARHVTQATQADQPRIVNAGTVDVLNGAPTVVFNGTSQHIFNTSPFMYAAGAATICAVISGTGNSNGTILVGESSASTNAPVYGFGGQQGAAPSSSAVFARNDANTQFLGLGTAILANVFDGVMRPLQYRDSGTAVEVFRNGASASSAYTRSGSLTLNRFTIGALIRTTVSFWMGASISEVICFTSALSTSDRTAIDSNQAAAFPI